VDVAQTCESCRALLYHSAKPGVGVALVRPDDDAVLLIPRRWPPHRGRWGVPVRFVAFGETPEAAAIREVREETGLELTWLVPSEHTEYKEGADGYQKGRPCDAAILRMVRAHPPVHLVLELR
jgi:8-oxo-dGTP pyrophosphatase MutT (NUDIX family)